MENIKEWKALEKKFGFNFIDEIRMFICGLYLKIEELTKSRNNWRTKYENLNKALGKVVKENLELKKMLNTNYADKNEEESE